LSFQRGTLKGENIYRTKLGRKNVSVDRATIKAILAFVIRPNFHKSQVSPYDDAKAQKERRRLSSAAHTAQDADGIGNP
jgi:hypothetical protein